MVLDVVPDVVLDEVPDVALDAVRALAEAQGGVSDCPLDEADASDVFRFEAKVFQ